MRNFIFILFLFTGNKSYCQDTLYSKQFYLVADYANKAELAICKNKPGIAERYYDSLFSIIQKPSGRDVWNRALLAKHMGNKGLEDSLVCILFNKGYNLDKIGNCFDTLILQPLITPEYRKIKKQHEAFANKIVRDDQRVNRNKVMNPDEWIKTWLSNIEKIKDYTRKVDSLKIPYYSLETSGTWISIIHYFQIWGNSRVLKRGGFTKNYPYMKGLANIDFEANDLVSFIVEQVEKGNYSQYDLAYYLSFSKYPFPYSVVTQYDSLVFVKEPYLLKRIGVLDSLNISREFLAVDSYENYYTKARFIDSLKNEGDIFKPFSKNDTSEMRNNCEYELAKNYHMTMFMKNPESAGEAIQYLKEKYGVE